MMTNKTLIATAAMAALTLGAVACDRSDKASTTNTTSAAAPNDPSTLTPVPQDQTLDTKDAGIITEGTLPQRNAPSMGPSQQSSDISGVNNRGSVTNSGTPLNGRTGQAAPDSTTEVAPGHIMFPPEKNGPGTGQPNSNGSHNIGASGPVDRR